jgi:hypothetical protein
MRKNVVNMLMEIKFRILRYFNVFNRVGISIYTAGWLRAVAEEVSKYKLDLVGQYIRTHFFGIQEEYFKGDTGSEVTAVENDASLSS